MKNHQNHESAQLHRQTDEPAAKLAHPCRHQRSRHLTGSLRRLSRQTVKQRPNRRLRPALGCRPRR